MLIASVVIGVIIRIKLSKRQHKQVPSMAVESQAVSVGESARAQSPNLVPGQYKLSCLIIIFDG